MFAFVFFFFFFLQRVMGIICVVGRPALLFMSGTTIVIVERWLLFGWSEASIIFLWGDERLFLAWINSGVFWWHSEAFCFQDTPDRLRGQGI